MVTEAQPADFQRLVVIVMVRLRLLAPAYFARSLEQPAIAKGVTDGVARLRPYRITGPSFPLIFNSSCFTGWILGPYAFVFTLAGVILTVVLLNIPLSAILALAQVTVVHLVVTVKLLNRFLHATLKADFCRHNSS